MLGRIGLERCRRPCLVANRATLPQKWPPSPRNVADWCEVAAMTEPKQPSINRSRAVGGGAPLAISSRQRFKLNSRKFPKCTKLAKPYLSNAIFIGLCPRSSTRSQQPSTRPRPITRRQKPVPMSNYTPSALCFAVCGELPSI